MKVAAFGLFVALLIAASAFAHGLLGWPPFHKLLQDAGVDREVVAALAVGWYFGTASMLAFSAITFLQAVRRLRGSRPVDRPSLWVIAAAYLGFGNAAFILRDFNPHFLVFVATGALIAVFCWFSSHDSPAAQPGSAGFRDRRTHR